jgi:NAD(P)-dependent dehydrogenase (short-subunit alcohol dehydrogenase family)
LDQPDSDFDGRDIVVTGGAGALGRAVVSALTGAGARCHVPFHPGEAASNPPFLRHGLVKIYPDIDLTEEPAVADFYGEVSTIWASIHLVGGFAAKPLIETSKRDLMAQLDTNLVSCFLCCRAALRAFGGQGGRFVNVAGRPALEPRTGAGMIAYTIAKAGVAALTVALAEEVANDGVLVNAVAPSVMDTPANRAAMPKASHALWPKVEEIAASMLFLASPANRVTRGAVTPVYGRS